MSFSDEDLSAYLDGEAGPDLRAAIDSARQDDPSLGERLSRMRSNDAHLRLAFEGEWLASAAARMRPPEPPPILAEAAVAARGARRPAARWATPIAAGLIAGVAIGPGAFWPHPDHAIVELSGAAVVSGPDLSRVLSTARSGVARSVAGAQVRVALSFRSVDGRLCRQFVYDAGRSGAAGIACREGQAWRMQAWVATASPDSGDFTAAGGPDNSVIAAALAQLGLAAPLDRAAEDAAIATGWSRRDPGHAGR